MAKKSNKTKRKKQKITIDAHNWNTTDADEILRRKIRADNEKFKIQNQHPDVLYFSSYYVSSVKTNKQYLVEMRSLQQLINSCNCPDYRTNQLGTCKHIEAVLQSLKKKGVKKFKLAASEKSDLVEIFLDPDDKKTVRVLWPVKPSRKIKELVDPYFSVDGKLLGDIVGNFEKLCHAIDNNKRLRKIRISKHIQHHMDYLKANLQKLAARETFLQDVSLGKRNVNLVKYPLLPYQKEGVLHLAFTERALLADEMGLGKTVQAIAACELLRQLHDIQRVLVITTASLKSEWEEQIDKFTDLPSCIIFGAKAGRLRQYKENHFFYLVNYEQVISDHEEIQKQLSPDVVILDEAQRIKNWRTKTASAIKELKSRYAFVLTGTPVENRIDDIYSIIQFLDPYLFGPLFRFNRDFYDLDEEGRPVGYKNLDELYRRLRSIMLCRKKQDVETALPKRLNNNYFVAMDAEQRIRYEEYEGRVARLMQQAKRRPLRKEDFEKLQKWLACMRMVCDTPYILDKDCRISPKLQELESILSELLEDPSSKVIIFSEWERMLFLVKEMADKKGLDVAWHTGSVPQKKRRENIKQFKQNSNCRLFLSTDVGSVGLNLQVANIVINLDLPWNPAKLEQRIARAWRKYQQRSVQVINLICENSIEHRMLYLLEQKQLMAKSVLTGEEELKSMKMPSGRTAFMERMANLMTDETEKKQSDTVDLSGIAMNHQHKLQNDLATEFADDLSLLQTYHADPNQQSVVLAVVEEQSKDIAQRLAAKTAENFALEVIDQKTLAAIQRLAKAGILTLNTPVEVLHDQNSLSIKKKKCQQQIDQAIHWLSKAERKQKMVKVLVDGGFIDESRPVLQEAFGYTVKSFSHLVDKPVGDRPSLADVQALTVECDDHVCVPNLFAELIDKNQKDINVKKLFDQHQSVIDYVIQMKMDISETVE